ncbi:Basic form of pathogenesis-related protein 1 [Vitis vinifera]|uniref:Basic form of pathogenesis-related protein 1 n=1 Tax=Vitis vinifera TaxID=29760 RepID=A0A438JMZ1_VITVI|nr:Basic form of pathogenesis-related protein 1 [Vitis vinifera]
MGLFKISLVFICLVGLALVHTSCAQNSQQDYLNAHNTARAQVGVGSMTWNNTVASYAQNYANQRIGDCNLVHSNGPYGENIAWGSGSLTGTDAVNLWVGRSLIMTTTPTHALVGNAGTILKLFGATQCALGALGFNATMEGGSSHATTIHRATMSDSVLIEDYRTTSKQVLSYHRSNL